MAVDLIVPKIGESITEVQIVQWLVSEGSNVARDQSLAVMESDKATLELPSPVSGTLNRDHRPAVEGAGGRMGAGHRRAIRL